MFPEKEMGQKPKTASYNMRMSKKRINIVFNKGTCFDEIITEKWNEGMPPLKSYYVQKDLVPDREPTLEEIRNKNIKLMH